LIVAAKFEVVEGGGDSKPTRHVGGLDSSHASVADDDDVAAAHGAADQNHFEFDGRRDGELTRAKEVDSAGAYVTSDQSDGEIFSAIVDAAEAKREAERGTRILALLREDADSMSRYAREAPHRIKRLEGHYAQGGNAGSEWRRRGSIRNFVWYRDRSKRNGCG